MADESYRQSAAVILLVRPAAFGFNEETAETNRFQTRSQDVGPGNIQVQAVQEFDLLVEALRRASVSMIVVDDTREPQKPDAVFPNNWISTHADGTVVLYPMFAPVRRLERRGDILELLETQFGFHVSRVIDLTAHELESRFLEGTGSIVFDHVHRCGYASVSQRTNSALVRHLTAALGYESVIFEATDESGIPVYHTNVALSIGERFVVVCGDAIEDSNLRKQILERLSATGRELVLIDRTQMCGFAGNVIEVEASDGTQVVVMSERAQRVFRPNQLDTLRKWASIVAPPIPTIETVGGGSVRCMIAEIHLPKK